MIITVRPGFKIKVGTVFADMLLIKVKSYANSFVILWKNPRRNYCIAYSTSSRSALMTGKVSVFIE